MKEGQPEHVYKKAAAAAAASGVAATQKEAQA
jgi:hypothetical protein